MKLAGIGTAIGLAVAFVLAKVMSSLLFGVGPTEAPTVTPTDACTFATVSIGALAVALLAATFPPGARPRWIRWLRYATNDRAYPQISQITQIKNEVRALYLVLYALLARTEL